MSIDAPRAETALLEATALLEETWPPVATKDLEGAWRVRWAASAGRRVCSARPLTPEPSALLATLGQVEAHYAAHGGASLLQLFAEQEAALAAPLMEQGYAREAETRFLTAPAAPIANRAYRIQTRPYVIRIAAPLAAVDALWATGGVGSARRAVMARAERGEIFAARLESRMKGLVFVAAGATGAMIHALHVAPEARRLGVGTDLAVAAARWAIARGLDKIAVAIEADNVASRALFEAVGFSETAAYAYWRGRRG